MTRKYPPPPELLRRSELRTFLYLVQTWGLIIITLAVALKAKNYFVDIVAFLFIGVLQYHLNILGHDGLHYLLSRNKLANNLICRLFLHGPQCAPLTLLRANHLSHHQLLGSEQDPDKNYYQTERFASRKALASWLAASFLGGNTIFLIKKLLTTPSNKIARRSRKTKSVFDLNPSLLLDITTIAVTQGLIAFVIYMATGSITYYLVMWVGPLFSILFGLNTLRSCLEHAERPPSLANNSFASRNHSFISNPIEKFILAPFSMNLHAEHHYWPSIPCWSLADARAKLLSEEKHANFTKTVVYHRSYLDRIIEILK